MKKWWRRSLNLVIVLALMLPCFLGISVYANDDILSADERLLLVEALRDIESQKELWGLAGVEFKDLCLGKPVQTYDYVENRLVPGRELFPITVNGELALWATKYEGEVSTFQWFSK